MVLKLRHIQRSVYEQFYSSVILNGTETSDFLFEGLLMFYSSVILNGTETIRQSLARQSLFYSSVILNGTETG